MKEIHCVPSHKPFLLPVNAINVPGFDMKTVYKNRICTSASLSIHGEAQTFWCKIIKAANAGHGLTKHSNVRKQRTFKDNDPITIALHTHFKTLMETTEVQASQFVKNEVGDSTVETITQDNEDDIVYLPSSNGMRPLYYC